MKKRIIYFVSLLAFTFTWGCSSEAHDHADHGDEKDGHKEESVASVSDEIIFTPEQAKLVGLELETVKPSDFYQVIKTSGQVLSAQGDEVTLSANMSGIISFTKPSLNEGASVNAGERLVAISSKNIVDGDPIQKSRVALEIAEKEYERAKSLVAEQLIAQKEFNEIKLNYENAKIAYGNFAGIQTAKGTAVTSPMSGFIKSRLVNEGEYVEVGQPLMTVTQNRRLQLRADVSERYYKDLSNITSANFKTPYDQAIYRLGDLNGRVTSYARSAGNQDFYLPVNFEFDNIGQIVSGSYVEVYLLSAVRPNVISVPVTALTEDQGVYFVYIQVDEEGYNKQEVKLGATDGERVEIITGLKTGDVVVSKGATYVKLASGDSSIPHGHDH